MNPITETGRLRWGAVLAGAALTVALTLALSLLGTGLGLAMWSPSSGAFGLGGALWWVVSNWIAVLTGAHMAGRLSNAANDADAALHGVTVWAIALLASALLLTATIGTVVGATARSLASAAPQAAQAVATNRAGIDALLARADSPEGVQAQLREFIADPSSIDRDSLVRAVAAQAGIPEDQADARLTQYEAHARATATRVRRVAAQTAIWSFVALMIGLGAACFGGIKGARETRLA